VALINCVIKCPELIERKAAYSITPNLFTQLILLMLVEGMLENGTHYTTLTDIA